MMKTMMERWVENHPGCDPKDFLLVCTNDHCGANGKAFEDDAERYYATFPLDDGKKLVIYMGRSSLIQNIAGLDHWMHECRRSGKPLDEEITNAIMCMGDD